MSVPLKLGSIEQQHLQELFDAADVMRDDLPYSPELAQVCRDFQDRTFKNANEAQVYGALLKYVRSGRRQKSASPAAPAATPDRLEHAKLLRAQRQSMPKLQPYTRDFDSARAGFARNGGPDLSPNEFWCVARLASASAGARRRTAALPA